MRVLISNDDGIQAPGLSALIQALRGFGEIWVVAPDREQSAVGHAITMHEPIRLFPWKLEGADHTFAISGTPGDCVKLALTELMPQRPDIVVSGINRGENTGISVIYSGTVSAATEGAINGLPSLAVSLASYTSTDYADAAQVARFMVERVAEHRLPPDTLLNVNVPSLPMEHIRGIRVVRQGRARFQETFDKRTAPRGDVYYWMDGACVPLEETDTDATTLHAGYVTVTPVQLDLTHHEFLSQLAKWPLELRVKATP
ncbi:5'/3'-nucleotidase SurE [bacterium]|nr:5'/3'-nucleotidase SurE [bacterium]MBU1985291.1 5'/3'-nucleotidase SurE [bacterium]